MRDRVSEVNPRITNGTKTNRMKALILYYDNAPEELVLDNGTVMSIEGSEATIYEKSLMDFNRDQHGDIWTFLGDGVAHDKPKPNGVGKTFIGECLRLMDSSLFYYACGEETILCSEHGGQGSIEHIFVDPVTMSSDEIIMDFLNLGCECIDGYQQVECGKPASMCCGGCAESCPRCGL